MFLQQVVRLRVARQLRPNPQLLRNFLLHHMLQVHS
jgi:hypothetical protein